MQGQTVINPSVKTKTSFAIIVDSESYNQAKTELEAYKKVIEQDGLGTYIIYHAWTSPDQIRELLVKLHSSRTQPLEGAVFVGDIPIPMLRDVQHLTTAFKMDQKRNWQQSSVPSDRFYDDFGLKFDFIKQDSVKPLYFYYSLKAESNHTLRSNIYSARIKPLEKSKTDKYTQLRNYLNKVVSVRTTEKNNIIDNITVARGHGYNSESRVAWAGEQLALREQFPVAFNTRGNVKFMDFDTYWPMKPYWLNEVLRPDLDVMLFHHHGSNDYQYINGYKTGSDVNTSIENIKLYLRSKVVSYAKKKGNTKEDAIEYYTNWLGVPRSWSEEAFDPELQKKDSIMNLTLDITVKDILEIAPNARFVMFDACYNGSFYEDEYIAGAYIFNEGKTIVTQGNTVNTIQDKWPDRFLGLLNLGLRVGQWGKYTQYLETHIIGDPTFHFAPNTSSQFDINEALTVHSKDNTFWTKALSSTSPDIQAIALHRLFDNNAANISELLKKTYIKSPCMIVRLECLILLSQLDDDNFTEVLALATTDSYELTRRLALDFIPRNGSDKLLPAVAKAILNDNTSERIVFKISSGLRMMDLDKLEVEIIKQSNSLPLYSRDNLEGILKNIRSTNNSKKKDIAIILDKSVKEKSRSLEISRFRNNPVTEYVDTLFGVLDDITYEPDLRLKTAEALGWYNYSYRKNYIIEHLEKIMQQEKDAAVLHEIKKTIKRLSEK